MRVSKRKIACTLLAVILMVGSFAGCNSSSDTSSSPDGSNAEDSIKDSVTIATANETPSLHSCDHSSAAAIYMNMLTYDTLFTTNMQLEVIPHLVADYKPLDDTTWQFTLREGVKFHNDEIMDAEDVKATIKYAKTFPHALQPTTYIESVEVVDGLTFTITTTEPYSNLLKDLTYNQLSILPKSLIDAGHDFNESPIGSGPYKYVDWTLGERVTFEAFPDYWDGEPAIKNMTWVVVPEGSSRTIMLETGEVDAIMEVETVDVEKIRANEKLKVYEVPAITHFFMAINNEVEPYNNQDFRLALNYGLNREDIISVALNGMGTPAVTMTPIGLPETSMENAYSYDLEKAKEYLAASGVDPATVEMPIICSDDSKRRAAEVIQASYKELGINATIVNMDLATYISSVADGTYIAAIGGSTNSTVFTYARGKYHSDSINGPNWSRLNDPEVDRMIDLASVTLDDAERSAILLELSAYLNEVATQVPLFQPTQFRVSSKDLMGFECDPIGNIDFDKMYWAQA